MSDDIVIPDICSRWIKYQGGSIEAYVNPVEKQFCKTVLSGINPKYVLDLAGGIGRGSVMLNKLFQWDCNYIILDGNGDDFVCGVNQTNDGDFYNSLDAAREYCSANGLGHKALIMPPGSFDYPEHMGKIDVLVSFLGFGFHWPIDIYDDLILNSLSRNGVCVFGIRDSRFFEWNLRQKQIIDELGLRIFAEECIGKYGLVAARKG